MMSRATMEAGVSNSPPPKCNRRLAQFRLRTLMLLTAIVAVQCAVCLPALKEWQAQNETPKWTDLGGTGSIVGIPTNCTFGRIIRIRRHDGRILRLPVRTSSAKPSATKS
jgi:hypothetical protein